MIHKLLFLTAVIISSAAGGIFTIQHENIKQEDFFYTIPHILEQIPELQIGVFDATDQDISRLGRSSINHNVVALLVNGIRVSTLQDGFLTGDLRPVANNAIDSIQVYTGVHTFQWFGRYDVVVNIITKDIKKRTIGAATYMGSETGDPTVLLKVLDSTEIPYNKEQFAAGEFYGTLLTGKVAHYGGINLVYMDRYSNRLEFERGKLYPQKNSSLHMEEIRKGYYSVQFNNKRSNAALDFAGADYNIFRYNQLQKRYYFFEGTRGKVSFRDAVKGDNFFMSLNAACMIEQGQFYTSDYDYIEDIWGDLSFSAELGFKDQNRYTLSLQSINPVGTQAITLSDSANYLPHNREFQISGSVKWFNEQIISTFSYPPGLSLLTEFTSGNSSRITAAAATAIKKDNVGSSAMFISCEAGYEKIFPKSSLQSRAGIEYKPELSRDKRGIIFDQNETVLWGEFNCRVTPFVNFSLYSSNYLIKSSLHSQYRVNGLTFRAGISLNSQTVWKRESSIQRRLSEKYDEHSETIPSRLTGEFSIRYSLFNEHVKLAIAIRDIGKIRQDFFNGCNVGPVVVSNFQFQF